MNSFTIIQYARARKTAVKTGSSAARSLLPVPQRLGTAFPTEKKLTPQPQTGAKHTMEFAVGEQPALAKAS